jgi:hypothetical protein
MFQMARLALRWIRASSIVKTGFGPFSSKMLQALRKHECMRCGCEINDIALLGNALVVEKCRVVLHCRECRSNTKWPKNVYRSIFEIRVSSLICELYEHTCQETLQKLDWHDALICVRRGYATFQNTCHQPNRAFSYQNATARYGDILGVTNCGECGAWWARGSPKWNDTECYNCCLPHSQQWHVRTSREAEKRLLLASG